ncbi:major facilitator superfamily domain-containing protein [Nemania sp. FL0031]|nr:major facilitator superfamily domain-containing protein [Nemania sp. FL0031]
MPEEKDVPATGSSNVDSVNSPPAQSSFVDNNDSSAHSSILKVDENATVNIESVRDVEQATPPIAPREPYTAYTESRQMFIVLIATFVGIFAPICGAVYLPSLILFQDIFHVSGQVINATVSVYSAIFAVTPLFGAPASDYVGRKGVYLITLFIFLVSNTLLAAVPPTIGGLFVLRIFQAIGASVVTSVGAGTVADVTEPSKRASRMGIFLLGPNLGPVLGPLIGGQFSTPGLWRWVFGFLSIACFPGYLAVLFFLPETLRSLVGNGSYFANSSTWLVKPRLWQKQIVPKGAYPKPPRLTLKRVFTLLTFVPNLIVSVGSGLQFSGLYCIYISFPRVWQQRYGWSGSETGYAYLVPAVFLLVSSLLVGRVSDMMFRRYKTKHDGQSPPPERRIDIQFWGYLVGAAGKIMFGWFVYNSFHPVAGLAASAVAAVGTGLVMVTSTAYQTECQPGATASLVALAGLLRNLGSAISAAIIDNVMRRLGIGWFFTGLGLLDVVWTFGLVYIRLRGHTYRKSETNNAKPQ